MDNPYDPKKEIEMLERAKTALSAPHYEDLRLMLGLDVERFCKLVEIDKFTYMKWRSGESAPSIDQRILFRRIFDIAKKKGLILR